MPSTYSTSLRFTLQATGEGLNVWGNILNNGCFALIDASIAGRYSGALSGTQTLTSVNGATDQSRNAILDITSGTGGTLTIPAVSKLYHVRNATSGDVIITNGGATTATVRSGERTQVMSTGTAVYKLLYTDMQNSRLSNLATPTLSGDAATKGYVDGIVSGGSGALPPISGATAGLFAGNNGTSAVWDYDGYQGITTQNTSFSITAALRNRLINCNTGAITGTLSGATALGSKFYTRIRNNAGSGVVTIVRSGSDTINGGTSITIGNGETVDITGDGVSAFTAVYVVEAGNAPDVIVQYQLTSGTNGAATVSATYNTVILNTVVRNVAAGAGLSSNQLVLPAGSWLLEAYGMVYLTAGDRARLKIVNVTDAATVALGASLQNNAGAVAMSKALGVVTITAAKAFSIQMYTNNAVFLGLASSSGDPEVYAELRATRVTA